MSLESRSRNINLQEIGDIFQNLLNRFGDHLPNRLISEVNEVIDFVEAVTEGRYYDAAHVLRGINVGNLPLGEADRQEVLERSGSNKRQRVIEPDYAEEVIHQEPPHLEPPHIASPSSSSSSSGYMSSISEMLEKYNAGHDLGPPGSSLSNMPGTYQTNYNHILNAGSFKCVPYKPARTSGYDLQGKINYHLSSSATQTKAGSSTHKARWQFDDAMQLNGRLVLDRIFAQEAFTEPTFDAGGVATVGDATKRVVIYEQMVNAQIKNNSDRHCFVQMYLLQLREDVYNEITDGARIAQGFLNGTDAAAQLSESSEQPVTVSIKENDFLNRHRIADSKTIIMGPGQIARVNMRIDVPQLHNFRYKLDEFTSTQALNLDHRKGEYIVVTKFYGSVIHDNANNRNSLSQNELHYFYNTHYRYSAINDTFTDTKAYEVSGGDVVNADADDIHDTSHDGGPVDVP